MSFFHMCERLFKRGLKAQLNQGDLTITYQKGK